MWEFVGTRRPSFAVTPGSGQESVWDYPRPPLAVPCEREVVVLSARSYELARSERSYRILETASPPTFYLPPSAVQSFRLTTLEARSRCEWKGVAVYYAEKDDPALTPVAWSYPDPAAAFSCIRGHVAFYPGRVACFVDGERVRPQPGEFYGGWVTDDVVGPFKGEPGTGGW